MQWLLLPTTIDCLYLQFASFWHPIGPNRPLAIYAELSFELPAVDPSPDQPIYLLLCYSCNTTTMAGVLTSTEMDAVRALLDEFEALPSEDPRKVEIMVRIRSIGELAVLRDMQPQTEH